jgi:hypothetical protein
VYKPDRRVVWGHAASADSEYWNGADTREVAEANARAEGHEWVQAGIYPGLGDFIPDPDRIIEDLTQSAMDNGCPDQQDDPFIFKDGYREALSKALEKWAVTYVKVNWWIPSGASQRVRKLKP